jgi:hypothetical protein
MHLFKYDKWSILFGIYHPIKHRIIIYSYEDIFIYSDLAIIEILRPFIYLLFAVLKNYNKIIPFAMVYNEIQNFHRLHSTNGATTFGTNGTHPNDILEGQ